MDDSQSKEEIKALNELVVNCQDLQKLDRHVGKFNVFRVLRFEYGELRHSNMLAWLFDPTQSHGLGDLFLRRWLMRILLDHGVNSNILNPVDVDCGEFVSVDVRREWEYIDLVILIKTVRGKSWVIAIENKVLSSQGEGQLTRYRKRIESSFKGERHIFVFLTKNKEKAEDGKFIKADYSQIYEVLQNCANERANAIGVEPKALIDNYLDILEAFMGNSEVADLARRIYKSHKQAIDLIIEHKPDALEELSKEINHQLKNKSGDLKIMLRARDKKFVRFIPKDWNRPGNLAGKAWKRGKSSFILFELVLGGNTPKLDIVIGKTDKTPDIWVNKIWELAETMPFQRPGKLKVASDWVIVHRIQLKNISLDNLDNIDEQDKEKLVEKILESIQKELSNPSCQEVIKIIAETLPDLDKLVEKGINS